MFRSIILTIIILLSICAESFNAQKIRNVKSEISQKGITESNFNSYLNYLLNSQINFDEEKKFVNQNIKNNLQQNFAEAIILKKQKKFNEAFKKIILQLDKKKKDFKFYQELVWLAKANDKHTLLNNAEINSEDKNLLNGLINYNKGNYEKSLKDLNEFEEQNKSTFEIYFYKSYCLRYLGDYQNALLELNKSEKLLDSNSFHLSQISNAKGSLYYLSDNYEKAKIFFQNANNHSKKFENNIEQIKSLINLAILEDENGQLYEARKLLTDANKIAKNINAFDLIGTINSELGVSYTYDDQLTKAETHYKIALEEFNLINQLDRISVLHNNLGKIYLTMFSYNSALEQFEFGLKSAKENKRSKILNLISLGDVYSNLSNYSKALKYYEDAKNLSKEIKEITLEFEVEMGLGILEYNLGRYKNSLRTFNNAKKLISKNENPFLYANVLHKIGVNEFTLNNFNKAENNFLESSELSQNLGDIYTELTTKLDLANLYFENKQIAKAEKLVKSIQPIINDYNLEYLFTESKFISVKILLKKNQNELAKKELLNVAELSKKLNEYSLQIEANYGLAKILSSQNKIEIAEKYYLEALNLIEENSNELFNNQNIQISHFSKYDEIYSAVTEFYITNNNFKKAFEIIDNSRSRNTFQNLLFHKLSANSEDKNLLNKYFELNWQNKNLSSEESKDSLAAEMEKLKEKFKKANPTLQNYFESNSRSNIADKQNSLKEDEAFVTIYIDDESTQFFTVSNSEITIEKINVGRNEIVKLISEISPYYSSDSTTTEIIFNQDLFAYNSKKSNELYQKVFKKLFDQMEKKKIILSLPNELLNFPLETLVTNFNSENSAYEYDKMNYLIEQFEISYSPSLNIFSTLQKVKENEYANNLLVGDPIVDNNDFYVSFRSSIINENPGFSRSIKLNPLKYSEEEINSISSILENSENLISQEATENNFKKFAPNSNIIHISSHSFLIDQQPFIVFSKDNDENQDGYLDKGEILELNLNSNLVVLSSCKSGLGEIDKCEGVLGMQKSFFDAGAKSVIVSLWDVNDKYTYLFMELFYENLSNGLSKSESLQKAKVEFIKKYSPNPYYWASFVLSGDVSKINIEEGSISIKSFYFLVAIGFILLVYFIFNSKLLKRS
ncbi:MAG: CHAT domain-containing protein [Ignavibacteriales bacterium]|nr:CHAT domain-containing protein [Ignavibacteriales bacterium]